MSFVVGAAAGLALMDLLSSKGQNLSITDTVTTNMTVNATTNIATDCFVTIDTSQTINIQPGAYTDEDLAELTSVCANCINQLKIIYDARMKLEADAASRNGSYSAQTANPILETIMLTGGVPGSNPTVQTSPTQQAIGPCTAACSNLVIVGVVQQSTLTAKQSCTVQNSIQTDIQQSIQGQISSYLKNQQDIIGQLESAFTSNTEAISANLASTMAQNVTNEFVEDLTQAMFAMQSFTVTGNSIIASNINQSFTGTIVGSLNVTNSVNDQLRQSASYSIAQTLLNKNDTIGDLSTDFLQVINTMSQLMEELSSQILIILGAILAAIMLVVGSLYIFNKNFHSWAQHTMGSTVDRQLSHFRSMQTDPEYRSLTQNQSTQQN